MSAFKCKMCGGALEVAENQTTAVCEYCGSHQTVSKTTDEIISNLFNRANNLRSKSEFDKAQEIYEKIITKDETDAEAYWGIVLCKYGIEYVEDPVTFKRVPTCHRTQIESVLTDIDYNSAILNADLSQKALYEAEAREFDRLQKDILKIANNEEPFDVFICYKETDEGGRRTQDSVIANDIYHQLTGEGFKVFYAAITLEDKLGQEYEPYIFAALNSAKVMLVVGSRPEYFNAVWVKNEWSRYLKIIKSDRSKLLIPCYKDMDAYDLPEEFAHLQAQDMSKIGFISDIVRGIEKVVRSDKPQSAQAAEAVSIVTNAPVASLIKRAYMFLEDGDWQAADEYFEKALDIDPENAEAYLGKLMAEASIRTLDQLEVLPIQALSSSNFSKALRFADEQLKTKLEAASTVIKERHTEQLYNNAMGEFSAAKTSQEFNSAVAIFKLIIDYKDSKEQCERCIAAANKAAQEEELARRRKEAEDNINSVRTFFAKGEINHDKEVLLQFKNTNAVIQRDLRNCNSFLRQSQIDINKFVGKDIAEVKRLIQEEIAAINDRIKETNEQINSLGIFKSKEKKELKAQIDTLSACQDALGSKSVLEENYTQNSQGIKYWENRIAEEERMISVGSKIPFDTAVRWMKKNQSVNGVPELLKKYERHVLATAKKRDTILFGNYMGEPIEWTVLSREDNRLLLIAKQYIEGMPFNANANAVAGSYAKLNWATSEMYSWVSKSFCAAAFNDDEKRLLAAAPSLITFDQFNKYLGFKMPKIASGTAHADKQCAETRGENTWWVAFVDNDGNPHFVNQRGIIEKNCVSMTKRGVRPVIWLNA